MSDVQTETGFAAVVPPIPEQTPEPIPEPALAPIPEQAPYPESELQAANEPVLAPDDEPMLERLIRFEAGTVHELMAHIKEWVEWRLAGGKPAAASNDDEAGRDPPAA